MRKISLDKKIITSIKIIVIIVGILVMGFGVCKGVNYFQAKNLIKQAKNLGVSNNYEGAINLLNKALAKSFTEGLKQEISKILNKYKQLGKDKENYNQGLESFNNGDWQEAIDLLSKVSSISSFYQDAQDKIQKSNKEIEKIKALEKARREENMREAKRKIEEECKFLAQSQISKFKMKIDKMYLDAQEKLKNEKLKKMNDAQVQYSECMMAAVIIPPDMIGAPPNLQEQVIQASKSTCSSTYLEIVRLLEMQFLQIQHEIDAQIKKGKKTLENQYSNIYLECLNKKK